MEKRVQDYTQEILDTIRSNSSPAVMGSRLEDYHENDLADVLPLLTVPERCKLYRILDTDMLSDIFEYAESVGRKDCGINERLEGDLIIPPFHDNGFFDLKHGGSPSQSGSGTP